MWRLTKAITEMKREHWTKRWNWSSCTKLALRTSWTHGLIAQSVDLDHLNGFKSHPGQLYIATSVVNTIYIHTYIYIYIIYIYMYIYMEVLSWFYIKTVCRQFGDGCMNIRMLVLKYDKLSAFLSQDLICSIQW